MCSYRSSFNPHLTQEKHISSLDKTNFSSLNFRKFLTMWGPRNISWFINPINYSYTYHKLYIVIEVISAST